MKKNQTSNTATYEAVAPNVYFDGVSYRTRVSKNGTKYSKSFPSKRKAVSYRNTLLAA